MELADNRTLEAVEAQRRCTVSTSGGWKNYRLEFEAELTRNVTISDACGGLLSRRGGIRSYNPVIQAEQELRRLSDKPTAREENKPFAWNLLRSPQDSPLTRVRR
jgi:hypothetical protein